MKTTNGWIGVDFDQTLAKYESAEVNGSSLGTPILPMLERVKRWLADGVEVRIVTARASSTNKYREVDIHRIRMWCLEHVGQYLPVTAEKDFGMVQLWDDRAISVEPNVGLALVESDMDPLSWEEELDMTWLEDVRDEARS